MFPEDLPMNKLELIDTLRFEAEIKKSEAAAVVNLFFNKMVDALANGDRIEIRRLCSFYVKEYKAYTGRNPKTGKRVKVKTKKLPFFKPGSELKERVDNK
jgi:integration host factor subunit beta